MNPFGRVSKMLLYIAEFNLTKSFNFMHYQNENKFVQCIKNEKLGKVKYLLYLQWK